MKHPEIFLVPAFMLADYYLTLVGAALKDRKYGEHFKTRHYELNPVWQRQVAQLKWFNPRHLLVTALVAALLAFVAESGTLPGWLVTGLLGCLLVLFGAVIGRHLSNILTFNHMIRKPDGISGQVAMSHGLLLALSLHQSLTVFLPVALIALFAPGPFTVGAVFGGLLHVMIHLVWLLRHRRAPKAPALNVADD
jgi:hypothetical protein